MAYFLGIFGGQGPNPSAALLNNGVMVAMAEEERFTRIKNAPSALPIRSIKFCLDFAKISIDEVEKIGFGWDCEKYIKTWPEFSSKMRQQFSSFNQDYDLNYENRILNNFNPNRIREDLKFSLAKLNINFKPDKLIFYNHHKSHAASTYFQSGFKEALVFSIDGSGEEITTSIWKGHGISLDLVEKINLPNSLGGFYATFTEFLGFKANSEEGKLMGLAPYGNYSSDLQDKISKTIKFDPITGKFEVNMKMRFIGNRSYNNLYTDDLVKLFGKPRLSNEVITQYHKDIAFNIQYKLEEIVETLVIKYISLTNIKNICLAGGVAMNCKLNGKLAKLDLVSNIFIQPASSDNGVSIGAAILAALDSGVKNFSKLDHCYFGPEFSDDTVENILIRSKLSYFKPKQLEKTIAEFIFDGKLIGWFQGRSEFGARALGNRSILASPLFANMRDKLNLEVKLREPWRPFCPSVLSDSYSKYFGDSPESPFMILAFPVLENYHELIPSVVHVDGTARPQSVEEKYNPRFYALLKSFGELSGHPVLINTSFNVQGEPIVNSPEDALRCFFSSGLDVLVLNNFVLVK